MFNKAKDEVGSKASHRFADVPARFTNSDNRRNLPGPSVKQLVRSLSSRYASVTSPLTKNASRSSGSASLKTMKTTAATSALPLTPSIVSRRHSTGEMQGRASVGMVRTLHDNQEGQSRYLSKDPFFSQRTGVPLARSQSIRASVFTQSQSGLISSKDQNSNPLQKRVMERVQGKSLTQEKHSQRASGVKQARRMSQVSRTDYKLAGRDNHHGLQLQQIEALSPDKEEKVESVRTAGPKLKELCLKQEEEIKTLKALFPATSIEMAQLRELCERQERELIQAQVSIPALQEQVYTLADQLKRLAQEVAQLKARGQPRLDSIEMSSSNYSGITLDKKPISNTHRRGDRGGLSQEYMVRALLTDKEMIETLEELNNAAEKEETALQERCGNALKDLRSSSKCASLESLKSIFTCTSPHFYTGNLEYEQGIDMSRKLGRKAVGIWNLKPT